MKKTVLLASVSLAVGPLAAATQDFDQIQIRTEQVSESIFMLQGSGGNIAVSIGEDGTFIVDDQFAPLTAKIVAAIADLTDNPVDFVINTHWHYDHTDGNENFGGAGAVIVSHANSRLRMETDQLIALFDHQQEAYSSEGLPKITFDESVRFHFNDETIDVFYLGRAHTDGDAMVYFRNANVIHTGDVFVRYGFPFIDQPNGGSVNGIIDVVNEVAGLTDQETVFIPGHGPLSTRNDLIAYRDMLITIRDRVRELIDQGRSLEQVIEANPTDGFPARGIPTGEFLKLVYDSLVERD